MTDRIARRIRRLAFALGVIAVTAPSSSVTLGATRAALAVLILIAIDIALQDARP